MLTAATQKDPKFMRRECQSSNQRVPQGETLNAQLVPYSTPANFAPGLVFGSRMAYYNSLRTQIAQPVPRLAHQNKVYFNLRSPAV